MTVSLTDLNQLGFFASHQITLGAGDVPRFIALKGGSPSNSPAVYLWVAHKREDDTGEVLYVGKAGKGVERRVGQHQNGFTNSGTGRKNAAALCEVIKDEGLSVTVMSRTSETVTLFGKTVSMYSTEENALCELFGPRLNRAVFPELSGGGDATPVVKTMPARDPNPSSRPAARHTPHADRSRIAEMINGRSRVQDEGTVEDMLAQVEETYAAQELALLSGLLELLEARVLADDHDLKVIKGYTGQPQSCNGITTLGFGNLVNRNFAPNGWVARIYLTDTPRVSFPLYMLNPAQRDRVEVKDGLFAPLDLEAFLRNPDNFLQAEERR